MNDMSMSKDITNFDFASLYPSTMISANIDRVTKSEIPKISNYKNSVSARRYIHAGCTPMVYLLAYADPQELSDFYESLNASPSANSPEYWKLLAYEMIHSYGVTNAEIATWNRGLKAQGLFERLAVLHDMTITPDDLVPTLGAVHMPSRSLFGRMTCHAFTKREFALTPTDELLSSVRFGTFFAENPDLLKEIKHLEHESFILPLAMALLPNYNVEKSKDWEKFKIVKEAKHERLNILLMYYGSSGDSLWDFLLKLKELKYVRAIFRTCSIINRIRKEWPVEVVYLVGDIHLVISGVDDLDKLQSIKSSAPVLTEVLEELPPLVSDSGEIVTTLTPPSVSPPISNPGKMEENVQPILQKPNNEECCVCYERPPDHAYIPCGHICICESCSKIYPQCPVCTTKTIMIVKTFRT